MSTAMDIQATVGTQEDQELLRRLQLLETKNNQFRSQIAIKPTFPVAAKDPKVASPERFAGFRGFY